LLFSTAAAARSIRRGILDLRACRSCGFVTNAAFDATLLDYGPAYENSQDCSPAFAAYLDELVERIVTQHSICTGCVVEVGCGKGTFLTRLLTHPKNSCNAVGFDPSYIGPQTMLGGRLRFATVFYSPDTAVPADAVVCRHVIEHVPDPLMLLGAIRMGIGSRQAKVFVETPCIEWIFRRCVPWDLFYEHCSLFTVQSLGLALTQAGFKVTAIRHVFGGQYLWAEAEIGNGTWPTRSIETASLAEQFAADDRHRTASWAGLLADLRGSVVVWGAGAKGVTFCNLADPSAQRIAAVVDVNPAKQGHFLPGTGHPIIAPEQAAADSVATVLVLNPNYTSEVSAALAKLGSPAVVIDLMAEGIPCD
jgi:hypothetical protein